MREGERAEEVSNKEGEREGEGKDREEEREVVPESDSEHETMCGLKYLSITQLYTVKSPGQLVR